MKLQLRSISDQVAAALRRQISARAWQGTLPGERMLAERFHVSRRTVRKALAQLKRDGTLVSRLRQSPKIARRSTRSSGVERVGLLLPYPAENARPFTLLWINRVMQAIQDSGAQLEIFHGAKYFGATAGLSLSRLTSTHPARCWILTRTNRHMQEWFSASGLPTVVCGSTHRGISLPSVDIDHRALCRHAAIGLIRAGHARLGMILDDSGLAGDEQSELGFHEGLAAQSDQFPPPVISRIRHQPAAVIRELKRILSLTNPPTALVLYNADMYLTVATCLGTAGIRVPDALSLVSRNDEPFLQHVHPAPARYVANPVRFATKLALALKRIEAGDRSPFQLRLMPSFVAGGSIAAPPSVPVAPA